MEIHIGDRGGQSGTWLARKIIKWYLPLTGKPVPSGRGNEKI